MSLFKNVRTLNWLGFRPPVTIRVASDIVKTYYSRAVSIRSSLRSYLRLVQQTDKQVLELATESHQAVRNLIGQAIRDHMTWQSQKLKDFTSSFTNAVFTMQDRVHEIAKQVDLLNSYKLDLQRCPYDNVTFVQIMTQLQGVLDELTNLKCSNMDFFISSVDEEIESILAERMNGALKTWLIAFKRRQREETCDAIREEDLIAEERESVSEISVYDGVMSVTCEHHMKVINHSLVLSPPTADTKKKWIDSLLFVISTVTTLSRPKHLSDLFVSITNSTEDRTYSTLTAQVQRELLMEGFSVIEQLTGSLRKCVNAWTSNQAIWRLNTHDITEKLGNNVQLWQTLLVSLMNSKADLENESTDRLIGCVRVSLEEMQSSLLSRYDALHKELLGAFASLVQEQSTAFIQQLHEARDLLEKFSVNTSTHEAINLILVSRDVAHSLPLWKQQRDSLIASQDLLTKQEYVYPAGWVFVDQIENDWESVKQILSRRQDSIKASQEQLKKNILAEDAKISHSIADLTHLWEQKKPLDGSLSVKDALSLLDEFQSKMESLVGKWEKVNKGRDALGLDVRLQNPLELLQTELLGLKEAWTAVDEFWKRMDVVGETLWSAVDPKKMNQELGVIEKDLESVNSRVRQYGCFTQLQATLRSHRKDFRLLQELKDSTLKERHWVTLLSILGVTTPFEFLRIKDFWTPAFKTQEVKIREVLNVSQGELALEEFLKQLREFWGSYQLELVTYQQRCKLIRGWETLFGKLDEHISALTSMKQSPYFKVFAEEALSWETKITHMRVLFDTWIDVQRRWVYLEGIFLGGADIIQQLPQDYNRFKTIDTDFIGLMRRVAAQPRVLDVYNLPNIQRTLERLSQQLNKIQKALGEFLEKQRQLFSRFYFVGDEDLLEILGNSKDPVKVQRHLNKMFAGINALESEPISDHGCRLTAMVSKEGEVVPLVKPVEITEDSSVVSWLSCVETVMQETLALLLQQAVTANLSLNIQSPEFVEWIKSYPSQIIILSTQVVWCKRVETSLQSSHCSQLLADVIKSLDEVLQILAGLVAHPLPTDVRKKYEQLITEYVYEKGTTETLLQNDVHNPSDFKWQGRLRAYYNDEEPELLKKLTICIADASFYYGYEYLGVCERLVQTPLTDRCFLTLTQALTMGLGGNPFGPAGTGKTESVKMLASLLGRFCLVFNCDEAFDFQAMGRIFRGLCQVGAWGCFDEFNRLEERILSAVSQQIWTIQTGLRDQKKEIRLLDQPVALHPNVGIFVTMNLGYAGRSNLPDNLKQLFRSIAMIQPDWETIAQVMLFSQGFCSSEELAGKIVLLFSLCHDQLSAQAHYDFGLRALKSVVVSAGNLKRSEYEKNQQNELLSLSTSQEAEFERDVLLRSVCDTVVPKLVAEDLPLLQSLLSSVFTGASVKQIEALQLRAMLKEVCQAHNLRPTDSFIEKALQLYQVQEIRHGVMLVGPSGSGKSSILRCLLEAMERLDGQQGSIYTIDPKAITKEQLFGSLDNTTTEWTDGIFTRIIRQIYNDVRGESSRRHWIVFDGDVDPEWAENLNSVLDDNKLLTLPTGDRLLLPTNVRILFEVENLRYATPASVSRCGTVWFSQDTVTPADMFAHTLMQLRTEPISHEINTTHLLELQNAIADLVAPFAEEHGLLEQCVVWSLSHDHIMETTVPQLIGSFSSLLQQMVLDVLDYNMEHLEAPMTGDHFSSFVINSMLEAALWGFGGSLLGKDMLELCDMIRASSMIGLPAQNAPLTNFYVDIRDGQWYEWQKCVPKVEIDMKTVLDTSVVIPTVDTIRNQHIMRAYLNTRRPVILCGPPGSGKTMTLSDSLKTMPGFDVVSVNFSSSTQPSLVLKIFDQYGCYQKTPNGLVLHPANPDKWLIVFCDEVNLPEEDQYGTQHVISFLRQIVEQRGFWSPRERVWVEVQNIQFVAACNPPTDPGRIPLSTRFLSHAPVLFVDYPEKQSLLQIYSTFNRALLQSKPSVAGMSGPLTQAMVGFYEENKQHFLLEQQPQYVYSPRELSRWMRALHSAFTDFKDVHPNDFIRLVAHEGLRLFCDRLVTNEEKTWCQQTLDRVFTSTFSISDLTVLQRPILFSRWVDGCYQSVDRDSLRKYLESRLRVFNEEELNVPLVLFDDVLEHVLRIDRVLRQYLGHLLLVGESGAGKTVLTRFVAWMNEMQVFQIKVSRRYSLDNFDEDLRQVMRMAGVNGQPVCFIFDESNILSTGFLERMNALLANGEVPGLYEGDEMLSLITACREVALQEGVVLDSSEELFKWFTIRVQRNLHVVFTMNPANGEFRDRAATSPALFNRCVVDWFGSWGRDALLQVSQFFTRSLDLDVPCSLSPQAQSLIAQAWGLKELPASQHVGMRDSVTAAILFIHQGVTQFDAEKTGENRCYCSPRDYIDFINQYVTLFQQKREELEDQRHHLHVGLEKLHETEEQVRILREQIAQKKVELDRANVAAQEKLKQIVEKKEQATKSQEISLQLAEELKTKYSEIAEKRGRVNKAIGEVEPLLREAKNSVKQINKAQLNEMRAMVKPPINVQLTIQAVCCLLGEECSTWKDSIKAIRKEDFISSIVNFNTSQITHKIAEEVSTIMSTRDFTYEAAYRSSRACGPLYMWVKSQLAYASIIQRVKPLNDEMAFLTKKSEELRAQHEECVAAVNRLNEEIEGYSSEYGLLTQKCQRISEDIQVVTQKSVRSWNLLESLESEQSRWKESLEEFSKQLASMIGDCIFGASFVTYGGFFDQHHRILLVSEWKHLLAELEIPFNNHFDVISYLSTSKDRLIWQSNGLPSDELCTQNAIILNRFNRYPLLVDPSGQGLHYLTTMYSSNRVIKTSFLDKSFMKQLESALRFGSILLVQDVENADPVLNPLLNKEFHKEGGRTLIRIGDQEVDFSPAFKLFLSTRDSVHQFSPDLCSRVTFVNFTMTPSSLQDQCLSIILEKEAPALYQKRNDLLQLQGEFQARLRDLEEQLLVSLNSLQGNILDDDSVMNNLEQLKREARTISEEIKQSDEVVLSIEESSRIYQPLSEACAQLYFVMDSLHRVSFLYRYNLQFFLDILYDVLKIVLDALLTPRQRMTALLMALYRMVYSRVSRGLTHLDSRILALRMCQLYVRGTPNEPDPAEFQLLLRGTLVRIDPSAEKFVTAVFGDALSEEQEAQVEMHLSLEHTTALKKHLLQNAAFWCNDFLTAPLEQLLSVVNDIGEVGWSQRRSLWRWLLLVKELRPELLVSASEMVVTTLCDPDFFAGEVYNMKELLLDEVRCDQPVLLCSMPGYDASKRVEQLYVELQSPLETVAMGNTESFVEAERLIMAAAARGSAVLLRNVHLCPEWLSTLEKMLFSLRPHASFRLLMTSEINPKLPPSLLRLCYTLVFETPTGIRASLKHSLNSVPEEVMNAKPVERCRVYFLLLWLHAVVEERLRYVPVGWTKGYEFSETDLKCSLMVLDRWIATASRGLSHMDPAALNWEAIQSLLGQSLYGGRIDSPFDDKLLQSLVRRFFVRNVFDGRFPLVENVNADGVREVLLYAPEGTTKQDFETWVNSLPVYNSPLWLGLPATAEGRLLSTQGSYILRSLLLLQDSVDVEKELHVDAVPSEVTTAPYWMTTLATSAENWLQMLLVDIHPFSLTEEQLKNPLNRYLNREIQLLCQLQRRVVDDLKGVLGVCTGNMKSTHQIRRLMRELSEDQIPEVWSGYYVTPPSQSRVGNIGLMCSLFFVGPGFHYSLSTLCFTINSLITTDSS